MIKITEFKFNVSETKRSTINQGGKNQRNSYSNTTGQMVSVYTAVKKKIKVEEKVEND